MKKFLKIFIPLVILGTVAYQFRSQLQTQVLPVVESQFENVKSYILPEAPCAEPIPYTLGTFDTRFGISKSYFLSALADAEAIWEKPTGLNLFVYAPQSIANISARTSHSDGLKVNLVYDYRQQATSKLAGLGITVQDNRASYDALKVKFTALQTDYEKEKSDYDARVQAFNQGDRTDVAEFQSLQAQQKNLNDKVDEINALVVALNRLITTLNLSVEQYNTTNVSRGESFEEGVYTQNGSDTSIDIYEFSSIDKLVRVLAHELGHALGLEHVDDPKAIMYKLNQGNNETLTKADLDALRAKCGIK